MDIRRIRGTGWSWLGVTLSAPGASGEAGDMGRRAEEVGAAARSLPAGGPKYDTVSVCRSDAYPDGTAGTVSDPAIGTGG